MSQMKRILWVKAGGLMEDPEFHWDQIGQAEGNTLKEVCDNLAAEDASFALTLETVPFGE